MSAYVIAQAFESDRASGALAKANAWLTLQGETVSLDTVVGDAKSVTIFYSVPTEKPPAVSTPGFGITTTSPGSFTTTNGA